LNRIVRVSFAILSVLSTNLQAQQLPDTSYLPPPFTARYVAGEGPVVYIDQAHNNFHTLEGRYAPFAAVLEKDGFRVESCSSEFSRSTLKNKKILVIANALPDQSVNEWIAPTESAFTGKEIKALRKWIRRGGSLMLIADHMPFGGAAADLASAFGYTFYDGFADDTTSRRSVELFTQADGSLTQHKLTSGSGGMLAVDSVASFTGQVFEVPAEAESLLNCRKGWLMALPDTAWVFTEGVKVIEANGFSQGAVQEYGKGKLAFFGEAAMFTAQIAIFDAGRLSMGMNSPDGRNNHRLLVNIIRWFDDD
jgi:hypothetical protein